MRFDVRFFSQVFVGIYNKKLKLRLKQGRNLLLSVTKVNSRRGSAFLKPSTAPSRLSKKRDILNFSKTIHRCQNDLHSKCCGDICSCSPPGTSLVYPVNDASFPNTLIRHDHPASLLLPEQKVQHNIASTIKKTLCHSNLFSPI